MTRPVERGRTVDGFLSLPYRILQKAPLREIELLFETVNPIPNTGPNYNGAPGQRLLVVRRDPNTGARSLDLMCWGMPLPSPKDDPVKLRVDVMSETVATTPAYRDAFEHRRCLVPVDGFCAWQEQPDGVSQPHAIRSADGTPLALTGLWDEWHSSAPAKAAKTVTIITVPSDELMAPIADRMPAILPRREWAGWLGEQETSIEQLLSMLRPYPAQLMAAYPVSDKVADIRNNDAGLIEPLA